jgi:hypothetical protein
MGTDKSDAVGGMSDCLSDLYVSLEDFTEEDSTQNLLKVLALLRDLRVTVEIFERFATEVLKREEASAASRSHDNSGLVIGDIYTRNKLRELYEIYDATLKNGVFHFKERHEVWLFVTENKQADREQYVDKLVGDTLYWQGQRMGRTDSLVINHKLNDERLMLFYRRAKYEFEGAAFRYEGAFEYVSSSGSGPTSFVLRRVIL